MFSTPFTPGGKAHGDVDQQYMRKTIIVTQDIFPYVKRRSKVVRSDSVSVVCPHTLCVVTSPHTG